MRYVETASTPIPLRWETYLPGLQGSGEAGSGEGKAEVENGGEQMVGYDVACTIFEVNEHRQSVHDATALYVPLH